MNALLELDEVARSFGGVAALRRVSLQVTEGTVVGLIGPNGAGKTTLFNVISGMLRADSGSVRLDGEEIGGLAAHSRAALGIARSFQNLGLMQSETVATNVLAALHRTAPYREADVFLRPWRLPHAEHQLRERALAAVAQFDLEGEWNRVVGDLSFATARFVELAAVVAQAPRLMLLDEPTTGLDVAEVQRLATVLERLRAEGTTIVVVAHDVDFVMRVCDRVNVLAEGQLLFEGEPKAVRTNPAVIEAYLGRSA